MEGKLRRKGSLLFKEYIVNKILKEMETELYFKNIGKTEPEQIDKKELEKRIKEHIPEYEI